MEAEIGRLNDTIKDYEVRLEELARQVEETEHNERRNLERQTISHKEQVLSLIKHRSNDWRHANDPY